MGARRHTREPHGWQGGRLGRSSSKENCHAGCCLLHAWRQSAAIASTAASPCKLAGARAMRYLWGGALEHGVELGGLPRGRRALRGEGSEPSSAAIFSATKTSTRQKRSRARRCAPAAAAPSSGRAAGGQAGGY